MAAASLVTVVSPAVALGAASFDCATATQPVEKLICSDAQLIELDGRLDAEYKKAIAHPPSRDFLRRDQRSWLTDRNYCSDRQCIQRAYETRIGELRALLAASNGPYSLVFGPTGPGDRDAQTAMCLQALKNLNSLKYEPPMTCPGAFDPNYAYLSVPAWIPLSASEAVDAALAWERRSAERYAPPGEVEYRFASRAQFVKVIARSDRVRAWQATVDIAGKGNSVRVVLLVYDQQWPAGETCSYDTKLGVLLPDRFQVDKRYETLSRGEVIVHGGKAYIASWSPSGRGSRTLGYLSISPTGWLESQGGAPPGGKAVVESPACQIEYRRPREAGKAPGK